MLMLVSLIEIWSLRKAVCKCMIHAHELSSRNQQPFTSSYFLWIRNGNMVIQVCFEVSHTIRLSSRVGISLDQHEKSSFPSLCAYGYNLTLHWPFNWEFWLPPGCWVGETLSSLSRESFQLGYLLYPNMQAMKVIESASKTVKTSCKQ